MKRRTRRYYQLPLESRQDKINQLLTTATAEHQPVDQSRIEELVHLYEGREGDALNVLILATRLGQLEEYLKELEWGYHNTLKNIPPVDRRSDYRKGPVARHLFFQYYQRLGLDPSKPVKGQVAHLFGEYEKRKLSSTG